MTIVAAVDALALLMFAGVTVIQPDAQKAPYELPALVTQFGFGPEGFGEWTASGDGLAVVYLQHLLLVDFGAEIELKKMYDSLALVDVYLGVLRDNFDLGGALAGPMRVPSMRYGPHVWFGVAYIGWRFDLRWEIAVL